MKKLCLFGCGVGFLITLIITVVALPALAQVSVDRAIVNFRRGDRPYHNVVVSNSGTEALYVTVVADEMIRAGFDDEKRGATESLLATPKRFSIQPQEQRTIRLVLKKPLQENEQVFRVKLLPQAKEFESEGVKKPGEKKTSLKVLFSVGLLVLAEPAKVNAKLSWERSGNQVKLLNEGNVNILFEEVRHCAAEEQDCRTLPAVRLYPQNTISFPVDAKRTLFIRKQVGEEYESLVIPAE